MSQVVACLNWKGNYNFFEKNESNGRVVACLNWKGNYNCNHKRYRIE